MRWSLVGLAALMIAAGVVLALRLSLSSSSSCPASAQGVGIPGSPPPYTPAPGRANQPRVPIMTIANTPDYKGTPPPGFASWNDYTQYVISRMRALPPGTAVSQFGAPTAGSSVGGESELAGVTNC